MLGQTLKKFAVVAFAGADYRSEQGHSYPIEVLYHALEYGIVGVADHNLSRSEGVGRCRPGIEQPQKVIDLGYCAYGRARVSVGRFLLYGNYRAQALDSVYIGPFHRAQKLTGIAAEGLHVSALTLSEDGVKGQRRLAAPAKASDHHEFAAR